MNLEDHCNRSWRADRRGHRTRCGLDLHAPTGSKCGNGGHSYAGEDGGRPRRLCQDRRLAVCAAPACSTNSSSPEVTLSRPGSCPTCCRIFLDPISCASILFRLFRLQRRQDRRPSSPLTLDGAAQQRRSLDGRSRQRRRRCQAPALRPPRIRQRAAARIQGRQIAFEQVHRHGAAHRIRSPCSHSHCSFGRSSSAVSSPSASLVPISTSTPE